MTELWSSGSRKSRLPIYIVAAVLTLVGGTAWARHAYEQRRVREAVDGLRNAETLAFGGVGITGTPSWGEQRFKIVMGQPRQRALRSLEQIYSTGNVQAKGYALIGINQLNPAEASQLETARASSVEEITVEHGCLRSQVRIGDVASAIVAGEAFPYDSRLELSVPTFPDENLLLQDPPKRRRGK